MILKTPHYYKQFKCIASECKDNCCRGGWEINIDKETVDFYMSLDTPFGAKLRDNITFTDEYCFKLCNNQCAFLDKDNLCEIHSKLGPERLGVVCTQFPRYTEYYGSFKETGIGLACEEAERIIFSDREYFSIQDTEIDEELCNDHEFDLVLAEYLFQVRDEIFSIMNSGIPFKDKLRTVVVICSIVQNAINTDSLDTIAKLIEALVQRQPDNNNFEFLFQFTYSYEPSENLEYPLKEKILRIFYGYSNLEILNDTWNEWMDEIFSNYLEDDNFITDEDYKHMIHEFFLQCENTDRQYDYLKLTNYFLFRYFMKGVYDHNILGKAQLIISSLIIILQLDILKWNNNHRNFTLQDRIDTVHVFSRQVEYSQDNLNIVYEEFLFDNIYDANSLLEIIDTVF